MAGDENCDRVEVLAVGLQRVRRGLAGAAVGKERGEPLWSRNPNRGSAAGASTLPPVTRAGFEYLGRGPEVLDSFEQLAK